MVKKAVKKKLKKATSPKHNSPKPKKTPKKPEKKLKLIGEVSNYFEHVGAASVKLNSELKVGDKIKFTGGEIEFEQEVKSMQIHREPVQKAKKGDEVGIKIKEKVRKGYKVFKV